MSFVRDLRVGASSLIRTPGLAVAVVLTLALGIGANDAIFTLVRGVLLKLIQSSHFTVRTGSPNTSRRGSIPSPGRGDAASLPFRRSGAPVAMLTVT